MPLATLKIQLTKSLPMAGKDNETCTKYGHQWSLWSEVDVYEKTVECDMPPKWLFHVCYRCNVGQIKPKEPVNGTNEENVDGKH